MNSVVSPVKKVMKPVCSMLQSNKAVVGLVLVLFVVMMMLPLDRVLGTNVKSNVVGNLKRMLGVVLNVIFAVLVLCFYFNNDVMSLVLTFATYFMLKL
tara:strand:+ start:591 stop:884 length:294 start_codon:yes stop_codon:yes gene_type:complete